MHKNRWLETYWRLLLPTYLTSHFTGSQSCFRLHCLSVWGGFMGSRSGSCCSLNETLPSLESLQLHADELIRERSRATAMTSTKTTTKQLMLKIAKWLETSSILKYECLSGKKWDNYDGRAGVQWIMTNTQPTVTAKHFQTLRPPRNDKLLSCVRPIKL